MKETKSEMRARHYEEWQKSLEKVRKINHDNTIRWEKELAELEKPELRHGDYGVLHGGRYFVNCDHSLHAREKRPFGISDYGGGQCGFDRYADDFEKYGNIFDDLKAMSKPLTEFEIRDGNAYRFTMKLLQEDRMKGTVFVQVLSPGGNTKEHFHMDMGRFESMCKQGLRLVATAKLKAGEKK